LGKRGLDGDLNCQDDLKYYFEKFSKKPVFHIIPYTNDIRGFWGENYEK
jgi:hypothetical protein